MTTTTETPTPAPTPSLFGVNVLDAFCVFAAEFKGERDPIAAMTDRLLELRHDCTERRGLS